QAKHCRNITLLQGTPQSLQQHDDHVALTLASHEKLFAKLVIGADGAHSWVRQQLAIPLIKKSYLHHAIIATVETEYPHQACASQLFYPDGIVAFLPLWRPYLNCLVWSVRPQQAQQLMHCTPRQFEHQLSALTQYKMGQCKLISERQSYPLTARYARQFGKQRTILIGDAAHTIHPLAGQGVNLGFADAKQITDRINTLVFMGKAFGQYNNLKATLWHRQKQAMLMLAAMQGIQDIFAGQSIVKQVVRGSGMNIINHTSLLKKTLISQAMGL